MDTEPRRGLLVVHHNRIVSTSDARYADAVEQELAGANFGLAKEVVRVVDSDPGWGMAGQRLLPGLREALGELAVAVEHVGSTSVPGLAAKPVLDIAVGLPPVPDTAALIRVLESRGYSYRGEGDGSIGLVFVWEDTPGHRQVHIHAIPHGGAEWRDYVDFRDLLRAQPELRDRYAQLKRRLARRFSDDRNAYTDAKAGFVAGLRAWHSVTRPGAEHAPNDVLVAHTADLDPGTLEAIRSFLDDVFDGEFDDDDWDHTIGGMHAMLWDAGGLIGHASVVQRRLLHAGHALRAGYVEAVGVRADRRRRGIGGTLMDAIERIIRGSYELGALGASDDGLPFYATRGWQLWRGPTSVLTPKGVERTPDEDGGIYVLPVTAPLDPFGEITCDWRPGDVW